jgi:hypothetical protein
MRRIVVIIFTLSVANSYGQTFDWWAQLVHWDGVSEWPKYMITQPAYMGPNALPVPRIGNGSIDSNFSIAAAGSLHFSKGDNTQNLTIYANYCLVKNVISFDASWIPYEHFTMSHAIKEQRHVFSHFYYNQHATGDIELNTTIQLLNRWRKNIQLALRIGYRFPTGTGLGVARYTDGPGYHFDLSFGKSINTSLKWIGMLGFYSWQLINVGRRQDDAFLFGTGAEWNTKTVRLQTYISGYLGYQLNSGDKPVVFRATVEKKIKRTSLLLGFQQGLHDFKYSSIEVGAKYRLQ